MIQLSLTKDQARAVGELAPRILLLAPAGSGKTEVLIRRIERILAEAAGESFRLLAATYTVKAAEEIRVRVSHTISDEAWRVDCDTIHGFALDWLRRYGKAVGVSADVIVYSDDVDRIAIVAEYIRSLGLEDRLRPDLTKSLQPILSAIDTFRTLGTEPAQAFFFDIGIGELYDAYSSALSLAGGIDFPGILVKFAELLEADPWVLGNFRSLYRHVLVDEGQDLTPAQSSILRALAHPPLNLFVVADDRQSINGFAGGSFDNAKSLVGDHAVTVQLTHNFRCALEVLNAAELLASHLQSKPSAALTAPGAPSGTIAVARENSPKAEAASVCDWAEDLLGAGISPQALATGEDTRVIPEDIAVIARSRWLLDPVISELAARGHRLSLNLDPSGLLNSAEGRLLFEALALIADPGDRPARRRLSEELSALSDISFEGDVLQTLRAPGIPALVAIADHIEPLSRGSGVLETALGRLGHAFGSTDWAADAGLIERYWLEYRSQTSAEQRSLKGYLRFVSRSHLARRTDPGIRILTIHRVKGLEFKAVALVAVYEGALPDYRARTLAEMETERRSLYVAITRARRVLRISWPAVTIDRHSRSHFQQPSQFLREAGLVS